MPARNNGSQLSYRRIFDPLVSMRVVEKKTERQKRSMIVVLFWPLWKMLQQVLLLRKGERPWFLE
jgi:hypothetical protein